MNRIYFTADLHFGHAKVLRHSLKRPFVDQEEMEEHDKWLWDLWCRSVDYGDTVYILGDLTCYRDESARQLLEKLPGRKYLIEGNHDYGVFPFHDYFQGVYQIKEMLFKPTEYHFLKEDFRLVMCHYPMLTWNKKQKGAVMLHGHCHGALDKYNTQSPDLRFDVGLDGKLADLHFLTLEDVYEAATTKIKRHNCDSLSDYARKFVHREGN